jgi:Fe-S cluster assembly iron-binding protein IscA
MLEVTQSATDQIAEYFKGKQASPIRIFLNDGGCCGPAMAMALDESRAQDKVFDIGGFQYLVNNDFLEQAQPIKVDFTQFGFKITSSLELGGGCSSSGCGSKSCGC